MTTFEWVNGLKLSDMNKIYNYLGNVANYNYTSEMIRTKAEMNAYLAKRCNGDIIGLIWDDITQEFHPTDKYFYLDLDEYSLRSFSHLCEAPYTVKELAEGIEEQMAENNCTLEDIKREILEHQP